MAGNYTSTDMCVTANGKVIIADTDGNLYHVDPENMATTFVAALGVDAFDYGGMFYHYDTGNIYWAPCDRTVSDPLHLCDKSGNGGRRQLQRADS